MKKPPKLAEWILGKVLPKDDWNTSTGDFEEYYSKLAGEKGLFTALIWYWRNILFLVPRKINHKIWWGMIMFKNYLTVALRNMRKYKIYSLINITGLSVGIACFLAFYLYISFELSYDNYHPGSDRIYRIAAKRSDIQRPDGRNSSFGIAAPAAPEIKNNFSQVENAARFRFYNRVLVQYEDKKLYESDFLAADQELFEIFDIPVINGDPKNLINRPGTIVITKKIAEKYFPKEDPAGKTIKVDNKDYEITGIIKEAPGNSHLAYNFIADLGIENWHEGWRRWDVTAVRTYLKLKKNIDLKTFERSMNDVLKSKPGQLPETHTYFLQPVKDIHLKFDFSGWIKTPGNLTNLYIFSMIGIFILLIALVNSVNLSTARSSSRAKEVGMRKVIGAFRKQLINQFLGESMLISLLAVIIAVCLVLVSLPFFRGFTGIEFSYYDLLNTRVILMLLILTSLIGLGAGVYPAILLSAFRPILTLKGIFKSGSGKAALRKCLVVFQFTVSVILIISTLIVYFQLDFMKNANLGFDKEQKLVINARFSNNNHESIKNEFLQHPDIKGATASDNVLGHGMLGGLINIENSDSGDLFFFSIRADYDFIREYNLKIIKGRAFDKKMNDPSIQARIINETAYKILKPFIPDNFIGRKINTSRGFFTIIGVVKDFHFNGLQYKINPLMIELPGWYRENAITLSVNTQNLPETMAFVKNKWKDLNLGEVFSYYFLDEVFEQKYRAEEQIGKVFSTFTVLGLCIAFLGLFGLALFTAEKRTKEIGIRKTFGASVTSIMLLLTKEFIKWVTLGIVIAFPITYFAMNKWLDNFAYRIGIGWYPFVIAAVIAIIFSVFTVSFQAIKAASRNPVESIKYE
ncbi:ABC transporter permease [candidate division KSB1 bacterium]